MKFTLKDYQDDAVRDVLKNLRRAARGWHGEDRDNSAFSLTATTGAGKTVMAAAAFEALFHGDDNYDFEAEPGAVVIWFSDDPALNEQTRWRLMEASDRLRHTDLVVVENTFNREKFDPGKVYFLNTQKLGKKSLLVRGFNGDEDDGDGNETFPEMRPDLRSHTIWDTIHNTIEDPELTLYLVLDEAHRGMGRPTAAAQRDRSTIVRRLINGTGSVPPMPVVWGISATVARFNDAMREAEGRILLPNVVVDSTKVQESGLLKDTIILDIPSDAGQYDKVLLRRGAEKLRELDAAWAEYGKHQDDADVVKPLMVFQVPNTPDPDDIGEALDTIFTEWPELPRDSVAHVLGEHSTQTFGSHTVPHISPERVQEASWVRVLIAKDAISTGWDCPRAEVMVSFRSAQDETHITQLMGRMVRTPLARRIPGSERLNAVDCLLPHFDKAKVTSIANALMKGGDDGTEIPGRRILINPREMKPNPDVPEAVWARFLSLPAQSLPQRAAKPVKRLTALAQELAMDGLLPDAGKKAHEEMHNALEVARAKYADDVSKARKSVLTVEGLTVTADLPSGGMSFDEFYEAADLAVIEDAYKRAARVLSPDVARTYAEHLADLNDDEGDREAALIEAHADIAAMGLVDDIGMRLDAEADKLANAWLDKYRNQIRALSDERQEAYRLIRGMSTEPQDIDLVKPQSRMEATMVRKESGNEEALPTYKDHLLCDDDGTFPFDEGASWETDVLETEMKRTGFTAWYRNPPRSSQDSLGIAYVDGGETRIVRPDFIFFATEEDGTVVADIVDPHGTHLADALPKLKGLAQYAETHADAFRRIDAVAKVDANLRVLDLKDPDVRKTVAAAESSEALYKSGAARKY